MGFNSAFKGLTMLSQEYVLSSVKSVPKCWLGMGMEWAGTYTWLLISNHVLEMLERSEALPPPHTHTHTHTHKHRMSSRHKLGRSYILYLLWKKIFFPIYRYYSTIFLDRMRKVMKKIIAVPYMTLNFLIGYCRLPVRSEQSYWSLSTERCNG